MLGANVTTPKGVLASTPLWVPFTENPPSSPRVSKGINKVLFSSIMSKVPTSRPFIIIPTKKGSPSTCASLIELEFLLRSLFIKELRKEVVLVFFLLFTAAIFLCLVSFLTISFAFLSLLGLARAISPEV